MTFFNSLVFRKAFKLASAAPAVDLMANLPVVVPDDIAESSIDFLPVRNG